MSTLRRVEFNTPLGKMIAISDEKKLFLLEFIDRKSIQQQIDGVAKQLQTDIVCSNSQPIDSVISELTLYFKGKLREFKTPLGMVGSSFQQQVWRALQDIPYGETRSYLSIAKAIGKPSACRAVARANSMNRMAIIIPCHRVINISGQLGGYAGGLERKARLINHEKTLFR